MSSFDDIIFKGPTPFYPQMWVMSDGDVKCVLFIRLVCPLRIYHLAHPRRKPSATNGNEALILSTFVLSSTDQCYTEINGHSSHLTHASLKHIPPSIVKPNGVVLTKRACLVGCFRLIKRRKMDQIIITRVALRCLVHSFPCT